MGLPVCDAHCRCTPRALLPSADPLLDHGPDPKPCANFRQAILVVLLYYSIFKYCTEILINLLTTP
jgi:hypothetical protein